ncbi:MAG TPA: hypothetical protein VMS56_04995 [Thermoanaerobaculia bacterium]|nr:hypothetical protein [Thermoanaerobaculia bacterium]
MASADFGALPDRAHLPHRRGGKAAVAGRYDAFGFWIEAPDPAAAVRKFVAEDGAELIGDASRIRGYGSIGTARKGVRVYALEAFLSPENGS